MSIMPMGNPAWQHLWDSPSLRGLLAYYLAMAYGMDPMLDETLQNLNAALKAA